MFGFFRAVLAVLAVVPTAGARAQTPLAAGSLRVEGSRLTIYSDDEVRDFEQTLNVGEATRVRTCYAGVCGGTAPGSDPLRVKAELRGPELTESLAFEIAPGGTFVIPGFQREGDYLLENVRLVDGTGRVLASAEPSGAVLHVRQILLTSATVTRLSLEDLRARGITLSQQNLQAFNFAVGFAFQGQTVTVELPVVYEGNGSPSALSRPAVKLDGLPPEVRHAVERWQPPSLIPFRLDVPARDPGSPPPDMEPPPERAELFGAIVIPGAVSYLNQFFDARLVVANGAPAGSGADLRNVAATLRLPSGEALRFVTSTPSAPAGRGVPVLSPSGPVIAPGAQGGASFTLEGLLAGTHAIRMDVTADLERPGKEPFTLVGSAQAAVEVVDARFHLTFNHPEVVREGEPYTLFVTVANLSRAPQNLVTLSLTSDLIAGAHKADAADDFVRRIETLAVGASETVEFRLVADLTGKCVATTFQSSSTAGTGSIRLRTGVGELGIPLSPASLVLPRFTDRLPEALVRANVRHLGLAYSLATAPAGAAPAGLPRILPKDVERRAVDLGEAGQRLFLRERRLESLEALLLDQLGNRHPLAEWDTLRRSLERARQAAAALGDAVRDEQAGRGLGAVALLDHFGDTMGWSRPFLAATVAETSGAAPILEVRRVDAVGTTFLARPAGEASALRSLPFGEMLSIADGSARAPFAVVGHTEAGESYRLLLHADLGMGAGRLVALVPNAARNGLLRVDFGNLAMAAGAVYEVRVVAGAGEGAPSFQLVHAVTGIPVSGIPPPSVTAIALPPFRVVGAVQDFELDRYGLGVSYLFNRPPSRASAEIAASYRIITDVHAQDTSSPPNVVDRVVEIPGDAAFLQPNSERVVNVRYTAPISPLSATLDGRPIVRHEHRLDAPALRDERGVLLDPAVPPVVVEEGRVGGLLHGVVARGTGESVSGARVELIRRRCAEQPDGECGEVRDLVAHAVTGSDGTFFFPFVEEPSREPVKSGFQVLAVVPAAGPEAPDETEEVNSTIRLQSRVARLSIALLGRGTVTGRLLWEDGAPIARGTVTGASTLFQDLRVTETANDGSFSLPGLPVGPVTITGREPGRRTAYATVAIERAGQSVSVEIRVSRGAPPRSGTVTGRVDVLRRDGRRDPLAGARVEIYAGDGGGAGGAEGNPRSDAQGTFRFEHVAAGPVTVQAADFSVSRAPARASLVLAADQTANVVLTVAEGGTRTVTGRVLFHDPLANADVPVAGAVAFIQGPGSFAYTDVAGVYRIEGVPTQRAGENPWTLSAIDFGRKLQANAVLPPILDVGDGAPVSPADLVLREMRGTIEGVVLDPLGQPAAGIDVDLGFLASTQTGHDGRFRFEDVPVMGYGLVAHSGNGLSPGRVGWFGRGGAKLVFGGQTVSTTIRLAGSGVVNLRVRTASSTGVRMPVRYKPLQYLPSAREIGPGATFLDTTTDDDGRLQLVLPVGSVGFVASNPFNGTKSASASIRWPGDVQNVEIVFDAASTVTGRVVGVDGVTPVPGIDVWMSATGLLPQRQRTNGAGEFLYELVPPGGVTVTTAGVVGTVERVGRADAIVTSPGQTLDLTIRLRAQGTVRGRVTERTESGTSPVPRADFYLTEGGYPHRRLPASGWFTAAADGSFEVAHVFQGLVTVVARDPGQVARDGRAFGDVLADFGVTTLPDVVLDGATGVLSMLVRDPSTGAPVSDCQIFLSNGEATVADGDGRVTFDALPLATYAVYAFHAPTGRGGRVENLRLTSAGQRLEGVVTLDQRGEISGTLWDDVAKTRGVAAGVVRLAGTVNGRSWGTSLTALATTESTAGREGRFLFAGIPVGSFSLDAGVDTSSRHAATTVALTATAPSAAVDLVLEPVADLFVRLYEKTRTAPSGREIDPGTGLFSVTMTSPTFFAAIAPARPYPGHVYRLPDVLVSRALKAVAEEATGEQRQGEVRSSMSGIGSGTEADPYRLVLQPKGIVRVLVTEPGGAPVPNATVTVAAAALASGTDGRAVFHGVGAGEVVATARVGTRGGTARGRIDFDDDVLDLTAVLEPVVAAHGVVYLPPPGDAVPGDLSTLVPAAGAVVEITDARGQKQTVATDATGRYAFAVLPVGSYGLFATMPDGLARAVGAGTLSGPDGHDNALPPLFLDAAAPQIVSISPPPGQVGVSRTAPVEIVFSEALDGAVLPAGATSPFFAVRSASGAPAPGAWSASVDAAGRQIVRFTPSVAYDNQTVYSVAITGGTGGVRDRAGRPLTSSGNVGSSFTTSDTVGPRVVTITPDLSLPVDAAADLRFDFSEPLSATDAMLDGDGVGDAAELSWDDGSAWRPHPVSLFLTRGGYTLVIQPARGLILSGDTGKRRIRISRLRDASGNDMPEDVRFFRMRDAHAPTVALTFPATAPDGRLFAGTTYQLVPAVTGLDDVGASTPSGDLDRVEFFVASASDPNAPATSPAFTARGGAFSWTFVAAYAGDGVAPRPFSVWVEAVDTSANRSNRVRVDLVVLPNGAPVAGTVATTATAPVAGAAYAGSTMRTTVSGASDVDGAQLTMTVELRRANAANPDAPGDLVATSTARTLARPAGGWQDLSAQTFDLVVPVAEPEGSSLLARVKVVDSQGATARAESAVFAVADDTGLPFVESFVATKTGSAAPATLLRIGERFTVEFRARDTETAVRSVTLAFDGVFASPAVVSPVAGSPGLWRTAELTVPATVPAGGRTVVATATALDWGGNEAARTLTFRVEPTADPTAPRLRWISPWAGALWPAAYVSPLGNPGGTAIALRVRATDRDVNAQGQDVPGAIASVEVRGPVDASGAPSGAWTAARLVSGTGAPGAGTYEILWRVPNSIPGGGTLFFEARVTDTGGHQTTATADVTAVPARKVYERSQTAVTVGDDMLAPGGDPNGPVFLLDGTTLAVYPRADGTVRALAALVLYGGGDPDGSGGGPAKETVLTAPEVTSYASAIPWYPLELAIGQRLDVANGARVDVTGRGLLGGNAGQIGTLPGERAAALRAGGSHGGRGGRASNLQQPPYGEAASVTDSIRDPRLPGSGAGGSNFGAPGGVGKPGGGVLRIEASIATVTLEGAIRADGESPVNGYGGGAGGSVVVRVGRQEGEGTISADGGFGVNSNYEGGGSGGRISISRRDAGLSAWDVRANGGLNAPDAPGSHNRGGAGTVFTEDVDSAGRPLDSGHLVVSNPADKTSYVTPLPSLGVGARLVSVDVATSRVTVLAPAAVASLAGEEISVVEDGGPRSWLLPVTAQTRIAGSVGSADQAFRFDVTAEAARLSEIASALSGGATLRAIGRVAFSSVEVRGGARLVTDDDVEVAGRVNDRIAFAVDATASLVLRDDAPVVTIARTPPASDVLPGTKLTANWTAADPAGIVQREAAFAGDPAVPALHIVGPATATGSGSRTLPVTQQPGAVSYVVRAIDALGRVTQQTASWNVLADTTAPVIGPIGLAPTRPGDAYTAGEVVTVSVTATDDVALATIAVTLDGQTRTFTASPVSFNWTVPPVAADQTFIISVSAKDVWNNVSTATRNLTARPLVNANAPTVSFTCPSAATTLPSGLAGMTFDATATDDIGVQRLEFYEGDAATPFSTIAPSNGTPATFAATSGPTTLPTTTAETVVRYRVRAWDASNNFRDATLDITVVPAVELNASGPNDWAALADKVAYLRTGTLVIDEPRTFAGLLVLRGATITHSATTSAADPKGLDLTVAGPVIVLCGGSIDVSGKGYPNAVTYPGTNLTGSSVGGAHLGRGGRQTNVVGSTYGSVSRPSELGDGGAQSLTAGGGRVRLEAGALLLEGVVRADANLSGAGGSVWITTSALGGTGSVTARGIDASGYSRGGGGAIALEYTTATGSVLQNLSAKGGGGSFSSTEFGGAGTIYVKGPSSTYGDVVIDNKGTIGTATELPSLGNGVAQAGSSGATLVTDRASTIPPYFVGHWVEVRGAGSALEGTWRIAAISDKTVTLEADGASVPNVGPGDAWQGVYRFDRVTVTGGAALVSQDLLRGQAPLVTVSSPAPSTTVNSGATLAVTFSATDDVGIARVDLHLGSSTASRTVAPFTNQTLDVSVPTVLGTSDLSLDLVATATDAYGQMGTTRVPLVIRPDRPPVVVSTTPPAQPLRAGQSFAIGYQISDDRALAAVKVDLTGATTGTQTKSASGTSATGSFAFGPIAAGVSGPVTAIVTVTDSAGQQTASAAIDFAISPDAPPTIAATSSSGSTVRAGSSFSISWNATDDVGLTSVRVDYWGALFGSETRPVTGTVSTGTFASVAVPADATGPIHVQVRATDSKAQTTFTSFDVAISANQAPAVSISSPVPNAVVRPGDALLVTFSNSDADGSVATVRVTLGSATTTVANPAATASASLLVPDTAVETTLSLVALATDNLGATAVASVPVVVRPDAPPTVAAASESGSTVRAGAPLVIRWEVSDDVGLASVRVDYTGAHIGTETRSASGTTSTGSFAAVTLPADATGVVRVQVRATDTRGQTTTAPVLDVTISANASPVVTIASPASGVVVRPGDTLPVSFTTSDDDGTVTSLVLTLGAATATVSNPPASGSANLTVPDVSAEETMSLTALATDDLGAAGTTSVNVVVRPDASPTVTATSDRGTVVRPGSSFRIGFTTTDDVGLAAVSLDVTGALTSHEERTLSGTSASGTFAALSVPSSLTTGALHVSVIVRDGRGQTSEATLDLTIEDGADEAPTVSLSAPPSASPNASLAVTATLADDRALRSMRVRVEGAFVYERLVTISAGPPEVADATRVVAIPVPRSAEGAATVRVLVTDSAGQTTESAPRDVPVEDALPPVIRSLSANAPAARSGNEVVVAAVVTEDARLESVVVGMAGESVTVGDDHDWAPVYRVGFTAPSVTVPTDVPIFVEARDAAGHVVRRDGSVRVVPAASPWVSFHTPSDGALFAPGASVFVHLASWLDAARVEYFLDGDVVPFAEAVDAPFVAETTIPVSKHDGDTVILRARAHRSSGETYEATRTFRVVEGDVLAPDTLIEADDRTHDDRTIVTTGTTIVRGAHRFAGIVLGRGSDLRVERSGSEGPEVVDVESTGPIYVSRDAVLGGWGLGYRGGLEDWNTSTSGLTLGNAPGSGVGTGGSHGGLGRGTSTVVATYGNVRRPATFGTGGGASSTGERGAAGGGVVRLRAPEVVVDGTVSSDADAPEGLASGAGAGGSILVESPIVRGAGTVSASGADPQPGSAPNGTGGGGRIAILGDDLRHEGVVGAPGGSAELSRGAAGTIFSKLAGERFGRLRADGGWAGTGAAETPLPSVGAGPVTFAEGVTLGDDAASWPVGVEGIDVEVRRGSDFVGRFRVEERLSSTRLRLEEDARDQLRSGDTYAGVQSFERILVRGNATLTTTDVLEGRVVTWDGGSVHAANGDWLTPRRAELRAETSKTPRVSPPSFVHPTRPVVRAKRPRPETNPNPSPR